MEISAPFGVLLRTRITLMLVELQIPSQHKLIHKKKKEEMLVMLVTRSFSSSATVIQIKCCKKAILK